MLHYFLIFCFFIGMINEGITFGAVQRSHFRAKAPILTIEAAEEAGVLEINKIRKKHGLKPLLLWPQLSDCARKHSQNMGAKKVSFGHQGFDNRFAEMQKKGKVSSFGENVAYCHNYPDPVQICVEGWMKSDGHRENILGDFEETGFGVAIAKDGKFYATQLFATRYK